MCGIFGVIGKKINIEPGLQTLAHRGPDAKGQFADQYLTLGFRRLSIIDLSPAGHQPMTNEHQNIWVTFNGEIYNFQSLRKNLENKHKFISNTDTEVLIHGYEEWGINKLLRKINGMFAFCLYDSEKKKVFLVRDRIGKKPLYYYEREGLFAFASEVKAFFKIPGFHFQINPQAFSLWLGFPYLWNNNLTLLEKVKKVPPAHCLILDLKTNTYRIKKYYHIPKHKNVDSFETNQKKLETLLHQSVRSRLIADVPIGILLSGGLDSSLITAIARQYQPHLNTINISFPNTITDESRFAQIVARHCKTHHLNLKIETKNIFEDFRQNIWIYDDLSTADGGLYSTYLLSQKIKEQGIKVALVGEGADEVFCGYTWFGFGQLPFKLLGHFLPIVGYYYAIMRIINYPQFFSYPLMLNKKLKQYGGSILTQIQQNEILSSLPNHYCMKLDKGSSAASVETRAPYLDYHLVEFMTQLPQNQKIKGQWYHHRKSYEKYILRRVASKYLPPQIYQRKKKGGMTPTYKIIEDGIKEYRTRIIQNDIFREYFSAPLIKKIIDSKPKIKPLIWQKEWLVWKFLIFQIWYEYYQNYTL